MTGGETEATKAAKAAAKERGLRLVLFGGGNLSIRTESGTASVRGYISGDRLFVRADHPEFTSDQIARHEVGHDMIAKGEIDPETVRERIREELGADKTEQLAGMYEEAYRKTGLNADEVWEEVICDSLGDMNIFSGTALEGAAKELLEPTKAAASAEREANRTRGPPKAQNAAQVDGEGKTSIEYDKENRPFVVVETDILAGVPKSQWVKTVKDNLRQKFPDGVTVGRNVIEINYQSRSEMTFSKYTQWLMETEPELYADKLRATDQADEILKATRNYVNEALMHPRKDSIQEFARGEVLLRIGGHDYSAQVVVAMRSNGKLLLYDILGLERTTIQQKKKSDTAIAKNPSLGTDRSTVSGFKDSISAPGEDVKGKSSQELESIEELRKSIEAVQSIGRKSVNELTAADLQKVEPFARLYWQEMGEKSPFFRAWFGDWRVNDATPVKVVGAAEASPFKAGKAVNADTGKTISWGDTLKGETSIHGNATERAALGQIKSIVENAVLLDTETSSRSSKSKMPGTAFMHSFYALVEDGEGTSLYKLFAEEAISAKSGEPFTRAYELKSIEKVAATANSVLSQTGGLTDAASTTGYSVADLFDLVKRSDAAFRPKDASKVVDEDGRPLVVYHGTDADFTVFDRTKSRANMDIQGMFFSPWEIDAGGMTVRREATARWITGIFGRPWASTTAATVTAAEWCSLWQRATSASFRKPGVSTCLYCPPKPRR